MVISPDILRDYNSLSWYKQAAVTVACFFYQFVTPDKATAFTKLVRYFKPIQASDQPAAEKADRVAEAIKPEKTAPVPIDNLRAKKSKIAGIQPQESVHANDLTSRYEMSRVLKPFVEEDLKAFDMPTFVAISPTIVNHLIELINDDEFSEEDFKKLFESFQYKHGKASYELLIKLPINESKETLRLQVKAYLDTFLSRTGLRKCGTFDIDPSNLLDSIKSQLPDHPERDKVAGIVLRLIKDDKFDHDAFISLFMNLKKEEGTPLNFLAGLSEELTDKELRQQVRILEKDEIINDLIKFLKEEPDNDYLRNKIVMTLLQDGQFGRAFEFTSPPHGKVEYLSFLDHNVRMINDTQIIHAAIKEALLAASPQNYEAVISSIRGIISTKINDHFFNRDKDMSPILALINVPKYIPKFEAIGFNRKLFEVKLEAYERLKQDSAELKAEYDIAQKAIFDSLTESPEALADYIKNNLDPETANHVASELADYYSTNKKTTALQKFVDRANAIELPTVLEE